MLTCIYDCSMCVPACGYRLMREEHFTSYAEYYLSFSQKSATFPTDTITAGNATDSSPQVCMFPDTFRITKHVNIQPLTSNRKQQRLRVLTMWAVTNFHRKAICRSTINEARHGTNESQNTVNQKSSLCFLTSSHSQLNSALAVDVLGFVLCLFADPFRVFCTNYRKIFITL